MITNINLVVDEAEEVGFSLDNDNHDLAIDTKIVMVEGDSYTGSYTVTPSGQAQTLQTSGLLMSGNLTINPIPSNYGLITWNGSTLTVS